MRNAHAVLALAALALLCAAPAHAQRMYKCVDSKGKVYYTQIPPRECLGQTTQELSRQGRVVKENKYLTPEQRAAREAERKQRVEQEKRAAEERRRSAALLNTYSSEKDIEDARARALRDAEKSLAQQVDQTAKAIKASEQRIAAARKRVEEHRKFYGADKPPAKVQEDIRKAEADIVQAQSDISRHKAAIEAQKKKYVDPINARYDDDKRRYIELTRASSAKR
jgi:hypothetical protein